MKFFTKNQVMYGVIMSAVIVGCLAMMELSGNNASFDKSNFATVFMMVAPVVILFLGLSAFKAQQGNAMSWKQGMKEGFMISLIYGIISAIVLVCYYTAINPEILLDVRDTYGMPGASNTLIIGIEMTAQLISALVFGSITSAVLALILKTKRS